VDSFWWGLQSQYRVLEIRIRGPSRFELLHRQDRGGLAIPQRILRAPKFELVG